jgi:hypothetical protein
MSIRFFLITAIKKNIRMASAEEGMIISVKGLSNESNCSKISYIRNPQNKANAATAYFSFLIPLFRYAEIDKAVNITENRVATAYNDISITSLISICWIKSPIICISLSILQSFESNRSLSILVRLSNSQ